ncbi:MAG: hypothetical protein IT285_14740 [Bdellovibrionales bacterium]|nr:hypothetical protein [Bdellovibrionales bacterium]
MSDRKHKQSGITDIPETFEGKRVWKHPYLLYGLINLLIFGFMGLAAWWALKSGVLPH